MNYEDIYDKLDEIFVEYTTHVWKNGWEHEADRLSVKLSVQDYISNHNLFLLRKNERIDLFSIPNEIVLNAVGYKIEIKQQNSSIRIDVKVDEHIYFYVDNDNDWEATQIFIIDLCNKIYKLGCDSKKIVKSMPGGGMALGSNPDFLKEYKREKLLNELLED